MEAENHDKKEININLLKSHICSSPMGYEDELFSHHKHVPFSSLIENLPGKQTLALGHNYCKCEIALAFSKFHILRIRGGRLASNYVSRLATA